MHDIFRPSQLDRLPAAQKRVATGAMKVDCSLADQEHFLQLCNHESVRRDLLLPTIYASLDPRRIPRLLDLDANPLSKRILAALNLFAAAIVGLGHLIEDAEEPPLHATLELWDRFLPWARFAHQIGDVLRTIPSCFMARVPPRALFLVLVGLARVPLASKEKMEHMPRVWHAEGFLELVIPAWQIALDDYDQMKGAVFAKSCALIFPNEYTRRHADDALRGAGGSIEHLASLVARHLRILAPLLTTPQTPSSGDPFLIPLVFQVCNITHGIDRIIGDSRGSVLKVPLLKATCAAGAVPSLTQMFAFVANAKRAGAIYSGPDSVLIITDKTLNMLNLAMYFDPKYIALATRHGFIDGLVECVTQGVPESLAKVMDVLLTETLTDAALQLQLIDPLVDAVMRLSNERDTLSPAFKSRPLGAAYHQAERAIRLGGDMLDAFVKRQPPGRACDNLKCQYMGPRASFRRCGGCKARFYCSDACQKLDWRDGHQRWCLTVRDTRLAHLKIFPKRQLSFMRFILNWYFTVNGSGTPLKDSAGPAIYCRPASILRSRGPTTVPLVIIELRGGRPDDTRVRVSGTADVRAGIGGADQDPTLEEWIDRAQRSRRRICVHVVKVPLVTGEHYIVMPLRSNMSYLSDTVARLAKGIPRSLTHERALEQLAEEFSRTRVPSKLRTLY
ncbi:MYND-type domain-containing protein [Mycena kentingensis (nom. inval.)]|nr:MYND-type domain-containing protein [Mycena kentingensis (nom. inval.)]